MVLSLCLFACKDNGEETGGQISSAQFFGTQTSISLTDTETKDESTRMTAFNEAVSGLNFRVYYENGTAPKAITGDACDYDTENIAWGTVGVYYVTVTPKTQGEIVNDEKVTVNQQLEVRIDHKFGTPDANGEASCDCGAVQTTIALPEGAYEGVTVNGFHAQPVNDTSKGDLKHIEAYGPTESGDVVNSMTAGTIRKGSSITLTGTVKSIPPSGDSAVWYYPNLGIALNNFTGTSPFNPTATFDGEQGMGIIVRNDGWVLMDGIGTSPRLLCALAGGSSNSYNYGSHTSAVNTNTFPWEYNAANMPADTSTWGDWAVYSSGTIGSTTDYAEAQNVRLTYSFRADNVIEIINENLDKDTSLTARIKVPDAYADESFYTVLHGEYVQMTFNSVVITEQEKLESVTFNGLGDDAKVNYAEGEVVQLADFDGTIKIKYMNNSNTYDPNSYELQVFRGENKDGATEPAENAEGWVTLEETTRLEADDTYFRIAVTVGSTTCYDTAKLGDDGFFKKITPNNIDEVYGYKFNMTVPGLGTAVLDSTILGNVGFAANADATQVVIAPVGVASAIPAEYAQMFSRFDAYVALRIYGEDFNVLDNVLDITTDEKYIIVASTTDYIDIVVGFSTAENAENKVVLDDVQATPIVIDLSGVVAPKVGAFFTPDSVPVNAGGQVTYTFNFASDAEAEAFRVGATAVSNRMHTYSIDDNALLDRGREGDKLEAKDFYNYTTSYDKTTHTLTLKLTVPADPTATTNVGVFPIYVRSGSESDAQTQTLNVYYAAPQSGVGVFELASGGKAYFSAVGSKLYYYVMLDKAKLTEADIKLDGLYLNVNGGAAEDVGNIDLGFTYAEGELTLKDTSGAINPFIGVNGTTADPYDIDHGFFFMGEVDVTKFGIETSAATWYFQVMQDVKADAEKNVYKVTTADGETTVAENTDAVTEGVEVVKQSCDSTGLTADVIKSGDKIVFIFNAVYTTSHFWEEVEGKHGVFKCEECGALYTDTAVGFATGALAGAKTKGLTVSFAYFTDMGDDWGKHTLKTSTNNLIIAGGTVDPWNVTTDGLEGELKTIAEGMQGTNLYPGKASGSQHNNSGVSPFVDTPSGYVTVVVDPDAKNGGIRFYINGQLKIGYTNTHEASDDKNKKMSVANIVKFFLEIAEKNGVTVAAQNFNTANYAIVQVGVLDEKAVATRYNNYVLEEATYPTDHTWSTDKNSANYDHCTEKDCGVLNPRHGTAEFPHAYVTDKASANYDKCIACGAVHPDHGKAGHEHVYKQGKCVTCGAIDPSHTTHTYVNGRCSVCDVLCAHEDVEKVGDKCAVCGGTLTETKKTYTDDELKKMNGGWGSGSVHYSLSPNSTFEFTAKFATNTNPADWSGFVTRIFTNGQTDASLFFQGNLNALDGIKDSNFAVAEEHTLNETLATYTTSKVGFTWKLTVVWASDNSFTVTLEVWEKDADLTGKPSKTATQYLTVSDSVYAMDLWIGPDATTLESASSVAQSYTYPAADAK